MGNITRFTETGRPESEIERGYQKKVTTFDTVPSLKQLVEGQIGKVYSDGNLNLYIRHKDRIFQIGASVSEPFEVTSDTSSGGTSGSSSAPPVSSGTISLKYDTDDFQVSGGYLQLVDARKLPDGVQGDIIYHDGDNWVVLNAGTNGQVLVTKGDGDNPEWQTIEGGGSGEDHSALSNLDYASAGHTGFEATLTKGNLTAGSNKITITGSPTNALIGLGSAVDVNEANVNHDSLLNTHNLTTSIDHNSITNTHNLTTDIDHNSITNSHNLTTDIDHNSITNTHNLTTDIDHDALTNFSANEHIDHTAVSILAGTGMSGGGTIDANRTLNCDITQYTDALARLAISESVTGIDYDNSTGIFSITTGYVIPTTTEESNWNSAYGLAHNAVTISDTNSINLSLTDQLLSADLTIQDTTSVDLDIDASGLKATVLPAGVDHNSLANLTTGDPHTQYTENSGNITQITTRNHNDTQNIQGGVAGEYNHLTNAQLSALHDAVTVAGAPLTLLGQQITFNYDTNDFQLSGNNLQVKDGGIAHSGLSNLDYASAGHTGFEPTVAKGNLTETVSSVLSITGGTGAIIGSGVTIEVDQADISNNGYLSSTDWNTFNSKQNALSFGNLTAGSTKVSIGGTGTGAVIGAGASVDVSEANIDHNSLLNTHNLTTSIDHNSITNTHNLTTDIDHNSITNTHNLTTDIDHDQLTNFSSNEHVDHTAVSVLAGTGMSGGGTIDANRTLDCTITQYTDALARLAISETITGIDYDNTTGVFSITSGYVIPTTTEESNWNSAYSLAHNILTIADTYSIDLSLTDQLLSADLLIQDTTSVDLEIDASGLKATVLPAGVDHGGLGGLSDDDHTQYALLAGRTGGQVLYGGTDAGDDLTLHSTSHATKGTIFFGANSGYDQVNDRLGIGITTPTLATLFTAPDSGIHIDGSAPQIHLTTSASGTTASDGCFISMDNDVDLFLSALEADSVISFSTGGNERGYFCADGLIISDGLAVYTDKIQARDSGGLALFEDGGKGIFIHDSTGYVGFGTATPNYPIHSEGNINGAHGILIQNMNNGGSAHQARLNVVAGPVYAAGTGDPYFSFIVTGDGHSVPSKVIASSTNANALQIACNYGTNPIIEFGLNSGIKMILGETYLTIGGGTAGIDYYLEFDGDTNNGVLTWMEDEDYFKFSDDILINSTEKIYFRDTAIHLYSADDGHLDITADASIDINGLMLTQNVQPIADNTYYLGKNDDDSPLAYKGIILKDQTTGTYYRLQIDSGAINLVDLTD